MTHPVSFRTVTFLLVIAALVLVGAPARTGAQTSWVGLDSDVTRFLEQAIASFPEADGLARDTLNDNIQR